jgi:hypothetical protein
MTFAVSEGLILYNGIMRYNSLDPNNSVEFAYVEKLMLLTKNVPIW